MQILWARTTFTLCGWGLCPKVPALVQRAGAPDIDSFPTVGWGLRLVGVLSLRLFFYLMGIEL